MKRRFLKIIDKIDNNLLERLNELIFILEKSNSIKDLDFLALKKMSGFKSYYRIRVGNYRLGFKLEKDIITLISFKHRKDIYKTFP